MPAAMTASSEVNRVERSTDTARALRSMGVVVGPSNRPANGPEMRFSRAQIATEVPRKSGHPRGDVQAEVPDNVPPTVISAWHSDSRREGRNT